ncbi:MAG: DUF4411 family protein [Dehalococcoidia bacterium]|nr:MAG: DUF4411 family protein [Dehalococcoidia bacterium]
MPDFWLDADVFIRSKNEFYAFDIAPAFWDFLDQKADEGIIASSSLVYDELHSETSDELSNWADARKDTLFIEPDADVQAACQEIADHVEAKYSLPQAAGFLKGADPWLVAHAKAHGGTIVTFEEARPNSQTPKIPDLCTAFNLNPPIKI